MTDFSSNNNHPNTNIINGKSHPSSPYPTMKTRKRKKPKQKQNNKHSSSDITYHMHTHIKNHKQKSKQYKYKKSKPKDKKPSLTSSKTNTISNIKQQLTKNIRSKSYNNHNDSIKSSTCNSSSSSSNDALPTITSSSSSTIVNNMIIHGEQSMAMSTPPNTACVSARNILIDDNETEDDPQHIKQKMPNRKKLVLISNLESNPLPRHAAFDFIQCKVGMERKVSWKMFDVLVLIVPSNTSTKQKDTMFESCKKAKKINHKLFICVIDIAASESAVFRAKCFKYGANMVTNDHHSLKKVLNIIGNKGFGGGNYSCPYCHMQDLSEDDLWYHVPLYHVNESQKSVIHCPICHEDKRRSYLLHLRNNHGPVYRGEIAPEYRDGILTHAFALVVVRRPSDNKFLVVQEAYNSGFWLPGGRVDVGETLIEAALRETKEEAGIDVDIKGILRVEHSTYAFDDRKEAYNRMRVIFYAEPKSETELPKSVPNYDSAGATFMSVDELNMIELRADEPREWFEKLTANFYYHSLDVLSCWKHDHRSADHPGEYFLVGNKHESERCKPPPPQQPLETDDDSEEEYLINNQQQQPSQSTDDECIIIDNVYYNDDYNQQFEPAENVVHDIFDQLNDNPTNNNSSCESVTDKTIITVTSAASVQSQIKSSSPMPQHTQLSIHSKSLPQPGLLNDTSSSKSIVSNKAMMQQQQQLQHERMLRMMHNILPSNDPRMYLLNPSSATHMSNAQYPNIYQPMIASQMRPVLSNLSSIEQTQQTQQPAIFRTVSAGMYTPSSAVSAVAAVQSVSGVPSNAYHPQYGYYNIAAHGAYQPHPMYVPSQQQQIKQQQQAQYMAMLYAQGMSGNTSERSVVSEEKSEQKKKINVHRRSLSDTLPANTSVSAVDVKPKVVVADTSTPPPNSYCNELNMQSAGHFGNMQSLFKQQQQQQRNN